MINDLSNVEYLMLSGSTAKAIMTKTGAKLADVKYTALQLKREGVLSEEDAQKYFDAQEAATAPARKAPKPEKAEKAPANKKRGRPPVKKEESAEEAKAEAPAELEVTKVAGRRRRGKKNG